MKHVYETAVMLSCALVFVLSANTHAQDKKLSKDLYLAAGIPDSLKEEANAVVRYSADELIVKGPGRAIEKHHSIVTILNEKGDDAAQLVLFYDKKFNSVSSMEMVIYGATGIPLKKYHKSDMYDRSAVDGTTLVSDYRLLAIGHTIASYPATVEVTYETNKTSYLDLGDWRIQQPERAVQYAEYKVSVDPAVGFRYKNKNTTLKPEKGAADGLDTYLWKVSGLKAFKPEEDALDWQVFPKISFASNLFKFDGIAGDISNWQNYGKWQLGLNADVNALSPARAEEIRKMTADIKTDKEKAKFLYKYMQQNMRYVSIQLGIGGLKPFPATFVDEKKYGDCKALSNYMYALLKAVNIPSYYALVKAGVNEEPADAAFPMDPFNHIIVCVPFKGDTTWLECTSNTQPFGKLGTFTENRNALLITETGGILVNTPKSTGINNQFNSEAHIILSADGSAKVKMKMMGTGEYRDIYIALAALKSDQQKANLLLYHRIKQPTFFEITPPPIRMALKKLTWNWCMINFTR